MAEQRLIPSVHPLTFGQTYCTLSGERWTVTYAQEFPVLAVNASGETRTFGFTGEWVRYPGMCSMWFFCIGMILHEMFVRDDKSKNLVCAVHDYPELARRMRGDV